MIIFPKLFMQILISGALVFIGVASLILIILLIRDYKGGTIW